MPVYFNTLDLVVQRPLNCVIERRSLEQLVLALSYNILHTIFDFFKNILAPCGLVHWSLNKQESQVVVEVKPGKGFKVS